MCVDLRKAHEQQKMLLEEDFEKLRLSLQVWIHKKKILNGLFCSWCTLIWTEAMYVFIVFVCVDACAGSSGHSHISKPESEGQSQALWGSFEEEYRWTNSCEYLPYKKTAQYPYMTACISQANNNYESLGTKYIYNKHLIEPSSLTVYVLSF